MNKRILIVDDEPEVLEAVGSLVRHEGYDVMLAQSGERALEILSRRTFDLVRTDLLMSGMSGREVLDAVKKQYPDIKVVLFTGYIDDEGKENLLDLKTDGHLVKPIDVLKMKALLATLLQEKETIGGIVVAVDEDSQRGRAQGCTGQRPFLPCASAPLLLCNGAPDSTRMTRF